MPQSLAQFGQTIKAKHPEYADMADEDVANRVLAKYPQYKDMVAPAAPAQTGTIRPLSTMERLTRIEPIYSRDSLGKQAATFVGDIGAGAIGTLAHPLDTARGVGASLMNPAAALRGLYQGLNTAPAETIAQGIGQAGAMAPIAELAPKIGAPLLSKVGDAAKEAGVAKINRVVGAMKPDFKRGVNPGQGYFDAKLGPSASMSSIAEKASNANADFGAKIGDAIDNSVLNRIGVKIPVDEAVKPIAAPINNAMNVLRGPGSVASAATPIQELSESFRPTIKQGVQNGGFTPRELFDVKKNVANNTNWSDPTQLGLKQVRQQIVGGLGDVVADYTPDLRDLNSGYRNTLKLAERAQDRASTGRPSLSKVGDHVINAGAVLGGAAKGGIPGAVLGAVPAAVQSVPLQTSIASGLYYGGDALGRLAPFTRFTPPAPVLAIPAKKLE